MKKTSILLVIISLVFLNGCMQDSTVDDLYITFTVTFQDEDNKNKFYSDNYYFNLDDDEAKKTTTVPYTSQYPLTVFHKERDEVYYTGREEGMLGDQIYCYQLKTSKTTRLTEAFGAINFMVPMDDTLMVGGVLKPVTKEEQEEAGSVNPILLDLKSHTFHVVAGWERDQNIERLNYNPQEQMFIFSSYSISEGWERIQNQTDEVPFVKPESHISTMKDGIVHEIYKTDGEILNTVINNCYIYYRKLNGKLYVAEVNAENAIFAERSDLDINKGKIIYIDDKEKFVYYMTNTTVEKYDTQKGKITVLFRSAHSVSHVNNAMILSE